MRVYKYLTFYFYILPFNFA